MAEVSSIKVKDADNIERQVATLTAIAALVGEVDAAPSTNTLLARLKDLMGGDYETVAASQTEQVLGTTGAAGDYLLGLLVVPASTSPGAVEIKDGNLSAVTVFAGGSDSVASLVPFFVPLGIRSTQGEWAVTTGANVSVVASGIFT